MIYLIDEKKNRQEKFGWSQQNFSAFNDVIIVIYDVQTFDLKVEESNFWSSDNIVLLHDSFFKNTSGTCLNSTAFKTKLLSLGIVLVIFGGSFSSIYMSDSEMQLPVSKFYDHLGTYLKNKERDIRILAFGDNNYDEGDEIKNKVWQYLYSFQSEYILNDKEIYALQEILEFNDQCLEILSKNQMVSQIKYYFSKWEI